MLHTFYFGLDFILDCIVLRLWLLPVAFGNLWLVCIYIYISSIKPEKRKLYYTSNIHYTVQVLHLCWVKGGFARLNSIDLAHWQRLISCCCSSSADSAAAHATLSSWENRTYTASEKETNKKHRQRETMMMAKYTSA